MIAEGWDGTFLFLGQLFDIVDLMKLVSAWVHPSTKSSFNFNEIWHIGRGDE